MPNLKTTPSERAAVRAQSSGIRGSGSELAARLVDDLDTLAAEVASHDTMRKTALALIASYEHDDAGAPEHAPSARRTLLAIAELLRSDQ